MIATGLATLTTVVRIGFADADQRFDKIDREIAFLHKKSIMVDERLTKIEGEIGDLKIRVTNLEVKMDQRFDEIIMLIKTRL